MKDHQLELLLFINNKETTASIYETILFIERFTKKEANELIKTINKDINVVYPVLEALSLSSNERKIRKVSFNKDIIKNNQKESE